MKNIIMFVVALISLAATAQEKKSSNAKHAFEVDGNCDQCKKRIEKAAYSVSGVKSAVWNVGDHFLNIIINEKKASVLDVQNAVAKAGHDSDNVKATDADYNNLHSCCLYERKK